MKKGKMSLQRTKRFEWLTQGGKSSENHEKERKEAIERRIIAGIKGVNEVGKELSENMEIIMILENYDSSVEN